MATSRFPPTGVRAGGTNSPSGIAQGQKQVSVWPDWLWTAAVVCSRPAQSPHGGKSGAWLACPSKPLLQKQSLDGLWARKIRGPPEFTSRIFLREDFPKAGEPTEECGRIVHGGLKFRTCLPPTDYSPNGGNNDREKDSTVCCCGCPGVRPS